jgi:hypothetical protein
MVRFGRVRLARAAVCATALLAPLTLGGCKTANPTAHIGPVGMPSSAPPSSPAPTTPVPSTSSAPPANAATTPAPAVSSTTPPPTRGASVDTGLTVFDGSSKVLINGAPVDFGTAVHDLAWSPDGKKAAFIDGGGNLVVANPDGGGKVEVAKNPGKEKWTHPTWQVAPADTKNNVPAKDNILFAVDHLGAKSLFGVAATAHDGTPKALPLNKFSGQNVGMPPTTGNLWPSAAGHQGKAVYEHDQGTVAQVYVRDDYIQQQGGKLYDGAEPALYFGDGESGVYGLVFVRTVNGHRHVIRQDPYTATGAVNGKSTDLTPNLTVDASAPAWSPDGKSIAFSTPGGVEIVSSDGSGAISQATTTPGVPAYRTPSS